MAQCWWCRCQKQTRDNTFKVCPEWKGQQKILWGEALKESGRRKHLFTAVFPIVKPGLQPGLDGLPRWSSPAARTDCTL